MGKQTVRHWLSVYSDKALIDEILVRLTPEQAERLRDALGKAGINALSRPIDKACVVVRRMGEI